MMKDLATYYNTKFSYIPNDLDANVYRIIRRDTPELNLANISTDSKWAEYTNDVLFRYCNTQWIKLIYLELY